jgi:hypothetical protein
MSWNKSRTIVLQDIVVVVQQTGLRYSRTDTGLFSSILVPDIGGEPTVSRLHCLYAQVELSAQ